MHILIRIYVCVYVHVYMCICICIYMCTCRLVTHSVWVEWVSFADAIYRVDQRHTCYAPVSGSVYVCVCVCVRLRVCVCVCVRERERVCDL